MAKRARVTKDTRDYDPELTTRGTPRKVYRAPTAAQRKKREHKEKAEKQSVHQEAANLSNNGMAGKLRTVEKPDRSKLKRYHIWLSAEELEWISEKAFREGVKRSEWVRRVLDAVRMADMGGTGNVKS